MADPEAPPPSYEEATTEAVDNIAYQPPVDDDSSNTYPAESWKNFNPQESFGGSCASDHTGTANNPGAIRVTVVNTVCNNLFPQNRVCYK